MSGSIVGALSALQERLGWLPETELRKLAEELGEPLHRLESVSTFYTHFRRTPPPDVSLELCRDLPCMLAGGEQARAALAQRLSGRDGVELREVSCLGRCDRAPAGRVRGGLVAVNDLAATLAAVDGAPPELAAQPGGPWAADPYAGPDQHYDTLRGALEREPAGVIAALRDAGLRGMGGAGFPTGQKWGLVAAEPATPRYVICNADESEPGTFKDRQILSDLPHLVLEGIILAAYCVGAERAWVFIRHEYEPERRILETALADAYARGALGRNVFGSGFSCELEIFVSPGGYILGEETALLECMEDRRGEPRNKPPFPVSKGLWNQPTLMNNVETFVHAVGIARNGAEWWRGLGRPGHAGHKFIGVSGDVALPGVRLVAMGTPLAELLESSGGMRDGARLGAIAPGGASSLFLSADKLDTPLDFESLERAGSMLGSGAATFIAADRDPVQVGLNVARFFRNESCGKCVPCRVGTEKAVRLVEQEGGLSAETEALLRELDRTLLRTSICGLGQVALGPLLSAVRSFPRS
jgi:NADH:ubiquinone oxidoreductase subunit F (NADH-binding)/NADH:ubiquinone oxidoreductase subunit E